MIELQPAELAATLSTWADKEQDWAPLVRHD
jgi:hypothetical protein